MSIIVKTHQVRLVLTADQLCALEMVYSELKITAILARDRGNQHDARSAAQETRRLIAAFGERLPKRHVYEVPS